MDTIVLKFGGSSVADNEKLKIVAEKIIGLYNKKNNIVVVVSAQGKTTDKLIKEAKELSEFPENREMDMLLSTGEQITIAKLSILLNEMGYNAISLTGWQAGIYTNNTNIDALVQNIDVSRIEKELAKRKIVVVAGFQGYNDNMDITTFGRGGSDTTAVAIAAALKAKKIPALAYEEMLQLSSEGAKVLHGRCVEIAEKYKIPIITKSTFNNKAGTVISDIIEENTVKSIVKKEISRISIVGTGIVRNIELIKEVLNLIKENKVEMLEFNVTESKISIDFKNVVSEKILEQIHQKVIE